MKLVERDSKLDRLRRLFADSTKGKSQVAAITGAVGSGKTALLHTFAESIAGDGGVFLTVTASRTERALELGVIGQLISSAVPFAEGDESARRLLDTAAHGLSLPESPDAASELDRATDGVGIRDVRSLAALSNALFRLGERGPVVIGVDDVHYADVSSLEVLLYLIRRVSLRPVPFLFILTWGADPEFNHPKFNAEVLSHQHVEALRLELLSRNGVAKVISDKLGTQAVGRLTPACHAMSGGNPLLVHALLEDYRHAESAQPAEFAPGEAFARAVSACLHRGAPLTMEAARAMAVLGPHATPPVLADVLGADPDSVVWAVEALHGLGLLHSGMFRHTASREAVLWELDGTERSALHYQAARVLHDHGTPATVVAGHFVNAGRADGAWTVPILREASEQALAGNDIESAMAWLRMAGRASTDEREQAAIKASLVRAIWRRCPITALPYLPDLSAAAIERRLGLRDTSALVGQLLWFGQKEQAFEVMTAVERQRGAPFKSPSNSRRSEPGLPNLGLLGHWSADPLNSSLDYQPLLPAPFTGALTYLNTLLVQGADEETLRAATKVLQGAPLDDDTLPKFTSALVSLACMNRPDVAAHWGDALLEEAEQRRVPMWQALFADLRAFIDIRRGRMATAERFARDALNLISPKSWGVAIGVPIANVVLASTAAGRLDDAAAFLGIPVPEATLETVGGLHYLHARGRYHLAINCPQAALADFETCGDLMIKWDIDLPNFVDWRTHAAQAWAALGNPNQVRDLMDEQLAGLEAEDSRVRGVSLRILASVAEPDEAMALLREAVACLEAAGDAYELALAVSALGQAHEARGEQERVRELTHRALGLERAAGLEPAEPAPTAPTTRAELRKKGVAGTPGPVLAAPADAKRGSPLTEAELRVAVLAAQGHKNRQIAAKLFITISTVEQHLTSVYRKLNVRRRAELSGELQRVHPGMWLRGTARRRETG
ncbi:regulatory LuxR family protein [Nonomuraea polychroma]|uniref:Regulatory LuxR family protein n=1 Tax=Nonomuraea polychroma TaxID=46176 RepID=A0A438LZ48_9ACTN|nr:LuxR family transcriptional regulator [Nonomuraea polychroma]RVX38762.1 regulatory LuxR family protein [Nonomuraea polychroma]